MTTEERIARLERTILDLYLQSPAANMGQIRTDTASTAHASLLRLRTNLAAIWQDELRSQGGG